MVDRVVPTHPLTRPFPCFSLFKGKPHGIRPPIIRIAALAKGRRGRHGLPEGITLGVSFGWHCRFGCHEDARRGRHALPGGLLLGFLLDGIVGLGTMRMRVGDETVCLGDTLGLVWFIFTG